jgi:hypothetical protein
MFVYIYSVFVLSCVGSGLATGLSIMEGVLPTVYKIKKVKRSVLRLTYAPEEATDIRMNE